MEDEIFSFITAIKLKLSVQRSDYIKMALEKNKEKIISKLPTTERDLSNISMLLKTRDSDITLNNYVTMSKVLPLPPYITWVPISRNQLINENELITRTNLDETQQKKEFSFSDTDDHILKETISKFGTCDLAFNLLAKSLNKTFEEIKERNEYFVKQNNIAREDYYQNNVEDKPLDVRMDSLNKLFCRRCYVFDCPTHGLVDDVIINPEKLQSSHPLEEKKFPCTNKCYLLGENEECLTNLSWTLYEKDLLLLGIKIFGNNSCLIAHNMLYKMKTCLEIHQYISNGNYKVNNEHEDCKEDNMRVMSPDLESLKDHYPHYTPCKCQVLCDRQCSCYHRGGCEKFCGCSKSCNIKNKGCSCNKGKCSTKRCPCFAAQRECDPDICKFCKLGCGDSSLGHPLIENGDHQCKNMKIFLRQHKKLLFGPSDVSGWGIFLKQNVEKGEFIGEYTGELIALENAEYLINKTYLFSLDEKFVIDPLRRGSMLKFANHSQNPNCYAKVVKVVGDNRIGYYSTRNIRAGEELFIDYCYQPELRPDWLKELEDNKCKIEDDS